MPSVDRPCGARQSGVAGRTGAAGGGGSAVVAGIAIAGSIDARSVIPSGTSVRPSCSRTAVNIESSPGAGAHVSSAGKSPVQPGAILHPAIERRGDRPGQFRGRDSEWPNFASTDAPRRRRIFAVGDRGCIALGIFRACQARTEPPIGAGDHERVGDDLVVVTRRHARRNARGRRAGTARATGAVRPRDEDHLLELSSESRRVDRTGAKRDDHHERHGRAENRLLPRTDGLADVIGQNRVDPLLHIRAADARHARQRRRHVPLADVENALRVRARLSHRLSTCSSQARSRSSTRRAPIHHTAG